MSVCWHFMSVWTAPFFMFFPPSPSLRQLLMHFIYDTPSVCVCVSLCGNTGSLWYCWWRNAAPSDSPDDLSLTVCSTVGRSHTIERQWATHRGIVFQFRICDLTMEIGISEDVVTTIECYILYTSVSLFYNTKGLLYMWNEQKFCIHKHVRQHTHSH